MEQTFAAETVASPDKLFGILSDLSTYPHWLDVVSDVTAATETKQPDSAGQLAWLVTLSARVGPFARSKRLRMVQTSIDPGTRTVVFDRLELDGRDHSAWQLHAIVEPRDSDGMLSASTLRLTYGGAMWSGLLDGILGSAAERAAKALQLYAAR